MRSIRELEMPVMNDDIKAFEKHYKEITHKKDIVYLFIIAIEHDSEKIAKYLWLKDAYYLTSSKDLLKAFFLNDETLKKMEELISGYGVEMFMKGVRDCVVRDKDYDYFKMLYLDSRNTWPINYKRELDKYFEESKNTMFKSEADKDLIIGDNHRIDKNYHKKYMNEIKNYNRWKKDNE